MQAFHHLESAAFMGWQSTTVPVIGYWMDYNLCYGHTTEEEGQKAWQQLMSAQEGRTYRAAAACL